MNKFTKATLFLTAGGLIPTASAELLEINYTDSNQVIKTQKPTEAYIGTNNDIQFSLSAGVERLVQLTITNSSNEIVNTLTSEKLGPADRITVNGKEYYGSLLKLDSIADGKYQATASILSASSNLISSETYDLIVDTTAPTMGAFTWSFPYGSGNAPDGLPKFSHTSDRHFTLGNITDDLSGIDKIIYKTYWESDGKEGQLYKTGDVPYYPILNKAMLGTGGDNSNAAVFFPSGTQSKHKVIFEVFDLAGNSAEKEMYFYNNSKCGPSPKIVAIEAIYRISKEAYKAAPGASVFAGSTTGITNRGLISVDDEYAYFKIYGPANTSNNFNYPNAGWTNNSTWRCNSLSFPNPEFTDKTLPPKGTNIEAFVDGVGWVPKTYRASGENGHDTIISKIRITGSVRGYEQYASMYGSSCKIPPGDSSCELDTNLAFNKTGTVGYYHSRPLLRSSDNTSMFDSTLSHVWEWDAQDPIINEIIEHDEAEKKISFSITELKSGSTWDRVKLVSAGIIIKKDGNVIENISASSLLRSGSDYVATVNYSNLDHGSFEMFAWAKDNYSNYVEKLLLSIDNDIKAPDLVFSIESGATIKSLDEITISLTDDNESKIKSVNLKGGPANENVFLATSETSEGLYALEYPVLFPDENSIYILTVLAEDNVGNIIEKELRFNYVAEKIGLESGLSEITLPATGAVFKDVDGNLPLYSKPIKLSDGSTISGKYPVFVTLRSDSEGSVFINNKEI